MKNINTKLAIMFFAGMLSSMIAVFAVTITVPTDFTSGTVQYLQKIVLKDAYNDTWVVINWSWVEKLEVNWKAKIWIDYLSLDSIDLIWWIKMNWTRIWWISNYWLWIIWQNWGIFISTWWNIWVWTDNPKAKLDVDWYIKVWIWIDPSDCDDNIKWAIRFNEDIEKFQWCFAGDWHDLN